MNITFNIPTRTSKYTDFSALYSSLYRYGYNGMEKDDEVKTIDGGSLDFGARMLDPRIGRWLSRDALANNYPNLSPYNYTRNNPIFFIDPDGNKIVPYGNKEDRDKFVAQLAKSTSLTVYYDYVENRIVVEGEPKTTADELLLYAANIEEINVNLFISTNNFFESRSGENVVFLGGSFEGSVKSSGKINAIQWVNPEMLSLAGEVGDESQAALHETLESYIGAILFPGFKPSPRTAEEPSSDEYNRTHYLANLFRDASVEIWQDKQNPKMFYFQNSEGVRTESFSLNEEKVATMSGLMEEAEKARVEDFSQDLKASSKNINKCILN